MVSGVYSTHPDMLDIDAVIPGLREGLKKHKSLAAASAAIRAQAPAGSQVAGLSGGMHLLIEQLIEKMPAPVRYIPECGVIAVDRDPITNEWVVIRRRSDGEKAASVGADYLVIATDGSTAARLLGPHIKGSSLPNIDPGPEVALVTLVVDQPALNSNPRGTGLLVSEAVTNVRAKALTHATAKWAWVAEEAGKNRHVVRLSYGRGGEQSTFSDVSLDEDQLITLALRDASKLLDVPITAQNLVDADVVRWNGVLPLSTPGYRERVQLFRERAAELDTVCTVGSWAAGSGLAAVVRDTQEQLDQFIAHITQKRASK